MPTPKMVYIGVIVNTSIIIDKDDLMKERTKINKGLFKRPKL